VRRAQARGVGERGAARPDASSGRLPLARAAAALRRPERGPLTSAPNGGPALSHAARAPSLHNTHARTHTHTHTHTPAHKHTQSSHTHTHTHTIAHDPSPTQQVRDRIVPANRRHKLPDLLAALAALYPRARAGAGGGGGGRASGRAGRRRDVLIEYVMLDGVNDSMDDARRCGASDRKGKGTSRRQALRVRIPARLPRRPPAGGPPAPRARPGARRAAGASWAPLLKPRRPGHFA
jgi:hypothetical protein